MDRESRMNDLDRASRHGWISRPVFSYDGNWILLERSRKFYIWCHTSGNGFKHVDRGSR